MEKGLEQTRMFLKVDLTWYDSVNPITGKPNKTNHNRNHCVVRRLSGLRTDINVSGSYPAIALSLSLSLCFYLYFSLSLSLGLSVSLSVSLPPLFLSPSPPPLSLSLSLSSLSREDETRYPRSNRPTWVKTNVCCAQLNKIQIIIRYYYYPYRSLTEKGMNPSLPTGLISVTTTIILSYAIIR